VVAVEAVACVQLPQGHLSGTLLFVKPTLCLFRRGLMPRKAPIRDSRLS